MKFKISDRVKYVRKGSPFVKHNNVGVIVSIDTDTCPYEVSFPDGTWWCVERNLTKVVLLKNQQLLFKFME